MKDISIYNCGTLENPPAVGSIKETPTGPLYLVSALEREGYKVGFNDLQILKNPTTRSIMSSLENSSNIVGISCMSHLLPPVILWINRLKKKNPDKTVILGGPGPTPVAREILEASGKIDIVVRGEGERTIVEVMECLQKGKDLRDVRGITYRDGNRIRTNPPQPRIENLDELPFPAYEEIDVNKYCMGIITTRGCPYNCGFCENKFFWSNKVTSRSPDNIIEEIKLIYERYDKNKELRINDTMFPIYKKRGFEFCNKLKKENIDIEWFCYGRINLMDEQLMKKMSESGCKRIFYGIESGSDRILKMINKGFTIKKTEETLKKSKKYFSEVIGQLIWGFPFETMEEFKKTVKFAEKFLFKMDIILGLNLLVPSINTQIYDDYSDALIPIDFIDIPNIIQVRLRRHNYKYTHLFNNVKTTYRYKTPNFPEKIEIMKKFIKKQDFYFKIRHLSKRI